MVLQGIHEGHLFSQLYRSIRFWRAWGPDLTEGAIEFLALKYFDLYPDRINHETIDGWVYKVLLTYFSKKVRHPANRPVPTIPTEDSPDPFDQAQFFHEFIGEGLMELSDLQLRVILGIIWDGKTQSELANHDGLFRQSVSAAYNLGLSRLSLRALALNPIGWGLARRIPRREAHLMTEWPKWKQALWDEVNHQTYHDAMTWLGIAFLPDQQRHLLRRSSIPKNFPLDQIPEYQEAFRMLRSILDQSFNEKGWVFYFKQSLEPA